MGGTADTRAVTHLTGHLPGRFVPPLTGHQGPQPQDLGTRPAGKSRCPGGAPEGGQCRPGAGDEKRQKWQSG